MDRLAQSMRCLDQAFAFAADAGKLLFEALRTMIRLLMQRLQSLSDGLMLSQFPFVMVLKTMLCALHHVLDNTMVIIRVNDVFSGSQSSNAGLLVEVICRSVW